jgi:DNA replication and repair protein RecF
MMFLKSLYLRNFRNYPEAELFFSPGFNLFCGDNAQGKTNLLEAITLVSTGRSFRAELLSELIHAGASFFFIEAKLEKEGIEHTVQISFDGKEKKLNLDGNSYATLQHLLGLLPSVLHTPTDSELIDGPPALRRRFLNLHLAQRDPIYIHHLSRYWRAMKQRNAGLKSKDLEALECWEIEMAEGASYLLQKRIELFSELADPLQQKGQILSGRKEVHSLYFDPSTPRSKEQYLTILKKNRPREQQLGATLTGPHRDDFQFLVDGKPARAYASEGQKKTATAALRLAEWEIFKKLLDAPAIFGLDDIALHLDETRQSLLSHAFESLGQVFLTATHLPSTWHEPVGTKRFMISAGRVQEAQISLS